MYVCQKICHSVKQPIVEHYFLFWVKVCLPNAKTKTKHNHQIQKEEKAAN